MATGYTGHDYTQDTPFDENPDDYQIGGAVATRSAEEIEKANTFPTIPPGDHLLIVKEFPEAPKENYYKVTLNGQLAGFTARSLRVRFCLPNDPRSTITDFFLLPPDDPAEQRAYFDGIPEGKKQAGWSASKFVHFINRLGFSWPAGQPLPEAARRLGNWKGRAIHAIVAAGEGTYTDRNGVEKARDNQIKPFSYRPAQSTIEGRPANVATAHGQPAGQASGHPAHSMTQPQNAHQAANRPAPARSSALDNL